MEKLVEVLAIVGAVTAGLPLLLRAVKGILLVIPGPQGEETIEKIALAVEKVVGVLTGFKPKK